MANRALSFCLAACLLLMLSSTQAEELAGTEPPPRVQLTDKQRRQALAGKPVFFTSTAAGIDRRGIAFKVAASQACIWSVLTDFERYATFIKPVKQSAIYRQAEGETCVSFTAKHWLAGTYAYHSCHSFDWPRRNWGVFELDQGESNDFDSASGFWRTEALSPNGNSSLVFYVADLQASGGIAKLFRTQFVNQGLKTATQWLPEATSLQTGLACQNSRSD